MIRYFVDHRSGDALSLPGAPDVAQRWRKLDEAVRSWLGLIADWLSRRILTLVPAP